MSFENLTPDVILNATEAVLGKKLSNLVVSLPSYINRVYEIRTLASEKLIVKFYRPGRWTKEAIEDEHCFLADCENAELPVVAPLAFPTGSTLAEYDGVLLAVFPKRAGRQLEITEDSYWPRIGSLIGRMHLCGEKRAAKHRVTIAPDLSTKNDLNTLIATAVPERMREQFTNATSRIISMSAPLFDNRESIRIHGDCHRGNILDRLNEGLLLIDFDDMAMGPPVQDLWLLLPDRATKCAREIDMFLEGYNLFRRFDRASLVCIESLRAMRMIYFLAWCARQRTDFVFKRNFPDWGSDTFWQKEINDLREQLGFIMEAGEANPDY